MKKECKATITINGDVYECEMTGTHKGRPHCGVTVKTSPNGYEGVTWSADTHGNVEIKMSNDVARCLFGPTTLDEAIEGIKERVNELTTMAYEAGKAKAMPCDTDIPF